MNVTELYRELKMTKDDFFPLVQSLGFDIGERAIKIDDRVATQIIEAIKQKRRTENKKSIFDSATPSADSSLAKETTGDEKILELPDQMTVKDFAQRMNKNVSDLIAILMKNGIMASINERLDYETAAIIAEDAGFHPQQSTEQKQNDPTITSPAEIIQQTLQQENADTMVPRPPVIVIMGHVDHGKTTLLDAIRQSHVAAGESGGITQHIGAYQVTQRGELLTFIDTPGHEAFTAMRARGARIADVAILVVAADDGVKPQTIEAIHILQEAKLPFVVAINKMDKPDADAARAKKELSELNVIPEEYGGNIVCVAVSAKLGTNINDLLDNVLLVTSVEGERLVANPNGHCVGTVIESHVDPHRGPIATMLVQNGTLNIGDIIQIGNIPGKIRAMCDWQAENISTATPSTPVQILGLKKAPTVGDIFEVVANKKMLKQQVKEYDSFSFLKTQHRQHHEDRQEKKKLALIVRADKLGSLEAITASLQNITHHEVKIDIVHKGLGSITESDIALAENSGALVFGFHVTQSSGAEKYARDHNVRVQTFAVIYQLLDVAKEELTRLLSRKITFEKIGSLRVLQIFRKTPAHIILGGRVEDGRIVKGSPLKLLRGSQQIGEGVLSQLQKDKKNIGEVTSGSECGLRIDTEAVLQDGDTVEVYEERESEQTFSS